MKIPKHMKVKNLEVKNGKLTGIVSVSKWYLIYISIGAIIKNCKFKFWQYPLYFKNAINLIHNADNEQVIG